MLSILLRLTLVCMIGYGGYRVFKEQMTARFCRAEAKKLESRFEELLVMNADQVHLRKMTSDASFCSWLYFAPAGEAFELQLQTKEATSTMFRVPSRSSSHYGLIQIQFDADDSAALPTFKSFALFGPDFKHYSQTAEKDTMYADIKLLHEPIGNNVNPIDLRAAIAPLSMPWQLPKPNQATHVFCSSHQKAVLAYFTAVEQPGAAKIKQEEFAITVVATQKR
jgi:hypothetical protein